MCAACVQDLQRQLEQLPFFAVALRTFLGVTPKTALQSRVKSTPEPACPIDPRVDELLIDIADVIDRTDGLRIQDLIQQPAMRFIVWVRDRRYERYLDGCHRALDVRAVHKRANNILGYDPIKAKRHAPCPECGRYTLWAYIGGPTVFCEDQECGASLSLDEYDIYCLELAER